MTTDAAETLSESRPFAWRLPLLLAAICLVVAVLLTWKIGVRSWPFLVGAALLLANRLGWLAAWQQDSPQRWLGRLTTGLFLTSLVLPNVQGCTPQLRGWQIAWLALSTEGELVYKAATSGEERARLLQTPYESGRILILLTGFNLANLMFATAAFAPWTWRASIARNFPVAATVGASTIWTVSAPVTESEFLLGWWIGVAAAYLLASLMKPPWFALAIPPVLFGLIVVKQLSW